MAAASARTAPRQSMSVSMVKAIRYLRDHVYPRGRPARRGGEYLRASDTILGMTIVMLAVIAVAYAITLAIA